MNSNKFILIVAGNSNSVLKQLLFKKNKERNICVLIKNIKLIKLQMKKLR